MGLHDAEEMLEAAQADTVRLERDVALLRAVIGRVADYAADQRRWAEQIPESERFAVDWMRLQLATALAGIVDAAASTQQPADTSSLSPIYRDGVPQTWQQVARDLETRSTDLNMALVLLSDLDRNANGRHAGDVDSSPDGGVENGVSTGNPLLATGLRIGYGLGGTHVIVVPPLDRRGDPRAWYQRRDRSAE